MAKKEHPDSVPGSCEVWTSNIATANDSEYYLSFEIGA